VSPHAQEEVKIAITFEKIGDNSRNFRKFSGNVSVKSVAPMQSERATP
jgi:hypothetical protein